MTRQNTPTTEPSSYIFSARELQRLAVYRAAIAARFYTDECEARTTRAPRPMVGSAAALHRSTAHAPVA